MINRRSPLAAGVASLAGLALVVAAGCSGGSPPPPPPVAAARESAPPPPPPKPRVTPIAELMTQLGIDPRVNLPEDKAPPTDVQRKAVLSFFDAFARGDDQSARTMLSKLDQAELDDLVESGTWKKTAQEISRIDVQTGNGPGGTVALAVFTVDLDFQPQLWYYETSQDGPIFDAVASPPDIMERLSGTDHIAAWFAIIAEELAMADEPDQTATPKQRDVSEKESSDSGPSMSPEGPGGPRGPGNPGKRPKPTGPPRRPPGPPG